MIYQPKGECVLATVTYGSHLYGTSTPTSDHDFKTVVLPPLRDLLLGRPLRVDRHRYAADGTVVGAQATMPDGGHEAEHVPLQKLVQDYLGGQAYAIELVYAVLHGAHRTHLEGLGEAEQHRAAAFEALCDGLVRGALHRNVQGMVGFAMKQTFDYVRRGERYAAACAVLAAVDEALAVWEVEHEREHPRPAARLDSQRPWLKGSMLDWIAEKTGLEVGTTVNHNRTMRTLKLNGREYLETTALTHFRAAVEKLVEQYGERSTRAAETEVDWKSLSHAVRVYQQVLELLRTGWITFPRPNAAELLAVKQGQRPLDEVKDLLRALDDQVNLELGRSTLPAVADAMRTRVEDQVVWLYAVHGPSLSSVMKELLFSRPAPAPSPEA